MADGLTRRMMLGGAAASVATPLVARGASIVLFVGNSFTLEHDVAALFADIARQSGVPLKTSVIAKGGAYLHEHVAAGLKQHIVRTSPALVVLQDHSTAPLVPESVKRSITAMSQLHDVPTRRLLFSTWPRAAGHRLYRQPGMPGTPQEMAEIVSRHYADMAGTGDPTTVRLNRVAPVTRAWMLGTGLPLHREDGYHASLTGAWLSALVLARTVGLAPSRPNAPEGVRHAGRLVQIALQVVPGPFAARPTL